MPICKDKFWVENPSELFCNIDIIPKNGDKLYKQMNAFTRLICLISLVLLIFKPKLSLIFFILSLLFIIILYYIQKNMMKKSTIENYKKTGVLVNRPQYMPFCDDEVKINPNDPNYVSINQRLAGKANPKTKIAPVVAAPSHDLNFWHANNLINHSHINTESQFDSFLSGYDVSNCCDNIQGCLVPEEAPKGDCEIYSDEIDVGQTRENYSQNNSVYSTPDSSTSYIGVTNRNQPFPKRPPMPNSQIIAPQPSVTKSFYPGSINGGSANCSQPIEMYENNYRDQLSQHPQDMNTQINSPRPAITKSFLGGGNRKKSSYVRENFEEETVVRKNQPGWVNTTCGYNPTQMNYNIPNNLAVGNCQKTDAMAEYNKNIFTQNIQPDSYSFNEVIEPINSNIGISFTQQFEPTSCSRDDKGLTWTEHDPRTYNPPQKPIQLPTGVTESEIYDPRFSGYGTSYRSYNEDVTGQTRFYYDDVNSVRMPNYITRSNIDFANYADSYGPLTNKNQYGNVNTNNIHALAQDSFLRCSIQQREELQEKLMRKRNAELQQLRQFPMHTNGQKRS